MFVFIWVLLALGVGFAAKQSGRKWGLWFLLAVVLTPPGGALALYAVNRFGRRP